MTPRCSPRRTIPRECPPSLTTLSGALICIRRLSSREALFRIAWGLLRPNMLSSPSLPLAACCPCLLDVCPYLLRVAPAYYLLPLLTACCPCLLLVCPCLLRVASVYCLLSLLIACCPCLLRVAPAVAAAAGACSGYCLLLGATSLAAAHVRDIC